MNIFINFSNHSSSNWSEDQIEAAQEYGEIIDVPFPVLEAGLDSEDIREIGEECVIKILAEHPNVVMCQGEFTLTFYVVNELMRKGITCVSACTKRVSNETKLEDGMVRKESLFVFEGFRRYI